MWEGLLHWWFRWLGRRGLVASGRQDVFGRIESRLRRTRMRMRKTQPASFDFSEAAWGCEPQPSGAQRGKVAINNQGLYQDVMSTLEAKLNFLVIMQWYSFVAGDQWDWYGSVVSKSHQGKLRTTGEKLYMCMASAGNSWCWAQRISVNKYHCNRWRLHHHLVTELPISLTQNGKQECGENNSCFTV